MFGDQSIVGLVSVDEGDAAAAAHELVELLIDPGSALENKGLITNDPDIVSRDGTGTTRARRDESAQGLNVRDLEGRRVVHTLRALRPRQLAGRLRIDVDGAGAHRLRPNPGLRRGHDIDLRDDSRGDGQALGRSGRFGDSVVAGCG